MEALFIIVQRIFESPSVFKLMAAISAWEKQHGLSSWFVIVLAFLFFGVGYLIWGHFRSLSNQQSENL